MPAGNDIVAWQRPRCAGKSLHQRFLNRTCLPHEQQVIKTASNPDMLLWLHWSLKEAAYKLSCFLGNRAKFHAIQFSVELRQPPENPVPVNEPWGQQQLVQGVIESPAPLFSVISYQDVQYCGYSIVTAGFIHSLAVAKKEDFNAVWWGIAASPVVDKYDYSQAVRDFAARQLNAKQPLLVNGFSKDADGIPYIFNRQAGQEYISLSHDQEWLSFAYLP
jgi:phosphopantetheinyl transferase (holo-ACP synthase)